ncbi:MAG: GFA family protein [Sphingopyxis sp.]|nr:GFA family protein [Sphingopyxis sp.]
MVAMREGGCRCGAIRFAVTGDPLGGVACHCRDCQYVAGGSANLTWVFDRAGFKLFQGEPKIFKATSVSGGSSFCSTCGAPLFSYPDSNPHLVAVKLGAFDDPSGFRVDADMWMESAQEWHKPHPGAAQFGQNPMR